MLGTGIVAFITAAAAGPLVWEDLQWGEQDLGTVPWP